MRGAQERGGGVTLACLAPKDVPSGHASGLHLGGPQHLGHSDTVKTLTPPSSSLLKRLLKGGGAAERKYRHWLAALPRPAQCDRQATVSAETKKNAAACREELPSERDSKRIQGDSRKGGGFPGCRVLHWQVCRAGWVAPRRRMTGALPAPDPPARPRTFRYC